VQRAPGFPCALCYRRDTASQTSGTSRRENANPCFNVIYDAGEGLTPLAADRQMALGYTDVRSTEGFRRGRGRALRNSGAYSASSWVSSGAIRFLREANRLAK
jgi:hypothetical protein